MIRAIRILLFVFLMTTPFALAQDKPAAPAPTQAKVEPKQPYDSTKAQLAVEKEKNLQLQFQDVQRQMQQQYQAQEAFIASWEASVRAANKWDETYTYDRATDSWTHAPKAAVKEPEKKK